LWFVKGWCQLVLLVKIVNSSQKWGNLIYKSNSGVCLCVWAVPGRFFQSLPIPTMVCVCVCVYLSVVTNRAAIVWVVSVCVGSAWKILSITACSLWSSFSVCGDKQGRAGRPGQPLQGAGRGAISIKEILGENRGTCI
jgi:hypothetical protein